jgi:Cof subfamily protein (haloacid dehalogenase superfamily)
MLSGTLFTRPESKLKACREGAKRTPAIIWRARIGYNAQVPIKLIAMDIDGTLLDSSTRLPAENIAAITEAVERGIEILLVTGRRFDFARSVSDLLPCDLHLIVSNGALIKSKAGETHQRRLLPGSVARRIVEVLPQYRAEAAVVFDRPGQKQVFLERIDYDDPYRGRYFRRNSHHIGQIVPLTDCFNGEDPIQVGFVGRVESIRAVKRALGDLPFSGEFTLALTEYLARDLSILDVMRRGVTKGFALAEWAQRRGIARGEIMAIGDNWNDREMLEFAGLPVVMGNAVPELKSLGWMVTLSNDENGVAEAIRTYALNGAARTR